MNKLRELRKNKGLLQGEVAKAVDVSQSVYARYESGKLDPSLETLSKLADFFGVSVDEVLGRPNSAKWKTSPPPQPDYLSKETVLIPIIGRVRAGYDALAEQLIEGYMEVEPSLLKRFPDASALKVWGKSMEPDIKEGDYVIITQQAEVRSGDFAVICVNGDEGTIKRVNITDDGIDLIPSNPSYGRQHFTAEQTVALPVVIQARVIRIIREV